MIVCCPGRWSCEASTEGDCGGHGPRVAMVLTQRGLLADASAATESPESAREQARQVVAWSPVVQALAYVLLQDVAGLSREKAEKLIRDAGV